jgi:hypothetical protein
MIVYNRAKVIKVISPNLVEMSIDLGYDLQLRRLQSMKGHPEAWLLDQEAMRSLVLLIGGRRIFVKTDHLDSPNESELFIAGLNEFRDYQETIYAGRLTNVNRLMFALSRQGFDSD